MCSSRKYPYPPPLFSQRSTEGRGLQKEAISEEVGGCLQRFFSADLTEIVELLINNRSSVRQAFSYFTVTGLRDKYRSVHCHATTTTKTIGNRPVEEAKKMKCYKRLIYKQFFQVSGLCGPQYLSYLPKRFTHLCRALYGNAILVYSFCAPIGLPEINKNIWSSLFL